MARLLAVNVGRPQNVQWRGETVHTGIWKHPVARVAAQAVEQLILDAINALPPAKQIETQPGSPSAELLSPGRDAAASA